MQAQLFYTHENNSSKHNYSALCVLTKRIRQKIYICQNKFIKMQSFHIKTRKTFLPD